VAVKIGRWLTRAGEGNVRVDREQGRLRNTEFRIYKRNKGP
jgi:hypothetical protein